MKNYYITTPIYYPSNKLTLGNCYTTVLCDAMARFHKALGENVFFLTGTDEHGAKIEKVAKESGKTILAYLDEIVADTKNLWEMLDVVPNRFIRTTDEDHKKTASMIFSKLHEKGLIYKSVYEGKYCTPCESFWTEEQLVNGCCPDCGRPVSNAHEESYFFKLSAFQSRIKELLEKGEFLTPQSRANEMLKNFVEPGLKDLCVSRKSVAWGIPVEFDQEQTIYVWIDALTNYLSAIGFPNGENFEKFWPANVHVVGKEIVRFHSIIWPAILMALDLPLPKKVIGHGWLLFGKEKLSKSKELKSKDCVDPRILATKFSSDAVRSFLIGEVNFGQDGPYTQELFLLSFNNILANKVGNIESRLTGMLLKYSNGKINAGSPANQDDVAFFERVENHKKECIQSMLENNPTASFRSALAIIDEINLNLDANKPWELAKNESMKERLDCVMFSSVQAMLEAFVLLAPFLPKNAPKVLNKFGVVSNQINTEKSFCFNICGNSVEKTAPLFQRLNIAEEMEKLSQS